MIFFREFLRARPAWLWFLLASLSYCGRGHAAGDEDRLLFTPPGFDRPGQPRDAEGVGTGTLGIAVLDQASGKPTPCRINVVGPDGNYYQPPADELSPYSLTGQWPKSGKGNREGKAPFRYYGRFFYCEGRTELVVPAGKVRIEVWKGLEFRPQAVETRVAAGALQGITITLDRIASMPALGYHSGDPHLHFARRTEADDKVILDLMEAEDIHYGSILAYNEPAGPYHGVMEAMDSPQLRGMGKSSVAKRGDYLIASGQEYRSGTFGHLNLFWRDGLVLPGEKGNADRWPLYGELGRETQKNGGFAIYAHGGYAQAIYADLVQKDVNAVELLQFGVYRGIELADWYAILNLGYRFPCVGASDYPACRKLGDCLTFVESKGAPGFDGWLRGAVAGRSFVTTGPLLQLEVAGHRPGDVLTASGKGPHRFKARIRVISGVAPVTNLQWVVGGRVVHEEALSGEERQGRWVERDWEVAPDRSTWIAARAFSRSPGGQPDAEAHTNPVYVDVDAKAPYDRAAVDRLIARIDAQMDIHRKRQFAEKAKVLDYFQKSRDILLKIRQVGGLPSGGVPADWIEDRSAAAFDPTRRSHADEELKRFLAPLPSLTPAQALRTFETVEGFRMELVAAEPDVVSPVAASFDADGNLYVAEMRDYPYKPRPGKKPLGTVRLLRDPDGDGVFDRSTVFADGLLWVAGIAPWDGGVFASAPPDIWYLKDTDGDFVADVRRRVFTGFGTQNQQAMVNNLAWGLDHAIYGSAAGNGGMVRRADHPEDPGVSIEGRDFRFDPRTGAFESITGTVQFGNSFDDWGNRFLCSESHPLMMAVLPQHYLARNPYLAVPSGIDNIAGGAVPIFRISPIERWRQIRSSRRIAHGERSATSAGASHHVADATAGVTIYRGSAYPPGFYGNAFVGDAQNNLVHRRILVPDGPTFRSERAPGEKATEFVRSSDNWFRPVNFVNAPDGTLHALDMSREILEAIHIPLDVVKHLDLKRGRDQGRIYRMAPPGFKYSAPPRMSRAATSDLVAYLKRPDAWYRESARRLIYERQDKAAVVPLRALIRPSGSPLPQTRIDALWSLRGLDALDEADLLQGLADGTPQVRAQALQLAEGRLDGSARLRGVAIALADDTDPRVRFQAAFSLGLASDPAAIAGLARIARGDAANVWIRTAVLSGCGSTADRLFLELWRDPTPFTGGSTTRAEFLGRLAQVIGARGRPEEMGRFLDALAAPPRDAPARATRDALVRELGVGLRRSGRHLAVAANPTRPGERMMGELLAEAAANARDEHAPESRRREAIALVRQGPPAAAREILLALLDPRQPQGVQVAALNALADEGESDIAPLLLRRFRGFAPEVQKTAIQVMLGRPSWAKALLKAAGEGGGINPGLIEPAQRAPLLRHRDPELARMAEALFNQGAARARSSIVKDYLDSLDRKGDPAKGRVVFVRECKGCHKVADVGVAIGPDLAGSPSRDAVSLLNNILDPNAYVLPSFVQYVAADHEGRTYAGIVAAETATSVTLRRTDGAEDTLLRSQIDALTSTGLSLMPEGLEKTIGKPEMADLLAFLRSAHRGDAGDEGPEPGRPRLDVGTLPGLIEPER